MGQRQGHSAHRNIARVVPDQTDTDIAWVVLSGFDNPHVSFTSNGGQSYSDLSGDLPNVPANDLLVDPSDSSVLYLATDLGIFRTADGGATWHGFSDGLPLAAVTDIFRHPADGSLIASTHGRSMFRWRDAASVATAVPDGSTVPGRPLELARTEAGELWLRFDTESCTAARYHLFHGPLADVAQGSYDDATCDLSRGGEDVIPMPGAAGESLFLLLAAATADGSEGPHGYDSTGTVRLHSGVGLCGVMGHDADASCP